MNSVAVLPPVSALEAVTDTVAGIAECPHPGPIPLERSFVLPTISSATLARLLCGSLSSGSFDSVKVIDSRFPYEYIGGHVAGAINLFQPEHIEDFYASNADSGRTCLVFHCEFSSSRAPKLFQFMRNLDRQKHADSYPTLTFPDMFILEGGYKAFFETHQDLCEPVAYVKMVDSAFLPQLRRLTSTLRKGWADRDRARGALKDVSNNSDPRQDRQEKIKRIRKCNF